MSEYSTPYLEPRQSRTRPPTDWEMELASALESAFARGAHELDELIVALNASRVKHRTGQTWTAQNFTELMSELGGEA